MKVDENGKEEIIKSKIPKPIIAVVITICAAPLVLNLFGADFGNKGEVIYLHEVMHSDPLKTTDETFHTLRGVFTHTLLEWSAFMTAIFTVFLAFIYFRINGDVTTPVIGVALLLAGFMDAFHTLAANRLIEAVADNRNLIPFTWAICRLFNALIMIAGVSIFLGRVSRGRRQENLPFGGPERRRQKGIGFIITVSLVFGAIAYAIIHYAATSEHLPETMFPDSLVTRPWDIVPLVLFLFAGFVVYPRFYRRAPSLFSHALIISAIPEAATQGYMAFGSTALFDNYFNIAHFLKIIAYLVPLAGLCLDYIQTHQNEKRIKEELAERLSLARLQAELGTAVTSGAGLRDILQKCMDRLVDNLNLAFARIWTLNEAERMLEAQASAGMSPHIDDRHARVPVGKFKIGLIALERKPFVTNSVIDDSQTGDSEWISQAGIVSFAGYPLIVGKKLLGVVAIFAKHPLSEMTFNSLASIVERIGLGIERKRSETELLESETKIRMILNTAGNGIITVDERTNIDIFNPAAEKIFGYSAEEVCNKKVTMLMPEEYRSAHEEGFARYLKTGERKVVGSSVELAGLRKDGSIFPLRLALNEMQFHDRRMFVAMMEDISARKAAEAELRNLSLAVKQSPSAVIITDTKGSMEYVNPKFENLTGDSFKEAVGQTPRMMKSGQTSPEVYADLWASITSDRTWRGEIINMKKDGGLYWAFLSISPVKNEEEEITHFLAIQEDITVRKNAEEALVKAKLKAEEANLLKTDFLNTISHELRTPLTVVIGNIEMLTDEDDLPDSRKEIMEIANDVESSAKHLLTIINDLLDLSKIEAGRLTINRETINIESAVKEAISLVQVLARKKGLELNSSIEGGYTIYADPVRVRQILFNLLSNAVKFTKHGSITVTAIRSNGMTVFNVKDTGCGMDWKSRSIIFDPFRQVDGSVTRKASGTGLGLAITKKLVELHEGKITVTSEINRGSTFTFSISGNGAG